MKQLSYYLKKGALILVVFMLLVIPHLNVYSSIGSYRIVSQSITANKNNVSLAASRVNDIFMAQISALSAEFIEANLHIATIPAEDMAWLLANCLTQGCYVSKHVTKPYTKYDFSDFDN